MTGATGRATAAVVDVLGALFGHLGAGCARQFRLVVIEVVDYLRFCAQHRAAAESLR